MRMGGRRCGCGGGRGGGCGGGGLGGRRGRRLWRGRVGRGRGRGGGSGGGAEREGVGRRGRCLRGEGWGWMRLVRTCGLVSVGMFDAFRHPEGEGLGVCCSGFMLGCCVLVFLSRRQSTILGIARGLHGFIVDG